MTRRQGQVPDRRARADGQSPPASRPLVVASAKNPRLKVYRELLTGRGLRSHGFALLAGRKQVAEALARHRGLVETILATPEHELPPDLGDVDVVQLAPKLFDELDVARTGAPLLVVRPPEMATWSPEGPWPRGCTLFIGFQNPENVGTLIRSAAAFGVARVVLLREAAHPYLPKSSRAAGPAILDVPLLWGPPIAELTTGAVPLIGLDARGADLEASPFPETFGLVAGLEGPGLPAGLRRESCRSIPMQPGSESLNAATATAIALYVWRRAAGKG